MAEAISKELASAKELILGFDAGCSACSGIATRIEERVGDRLVIRNLRDPELMEWRRRSLGEAAPWAPTLFEVEGGKVRAWVGMKMGLALSRRLGPKDTWRVMQTLGELGAAPRLQDPSVLEALPARTQEAVVGISRGQFLKGVGGAAVAASLLSGGALFPSAAVAATTFTSGTATQQTTIRSIVGNSRQFKALRDQQAQLGVGFNLGSAPTKVSTYNGGLLGTIITRSLAPQVRMVATFVVNLDTKALVTYRHVVLGNKSTVETGGKRRSTVMKYEHGLAAKTNHRTIFGDNYVITNDNRIVNPVQFKEEIKAQAQQTVMTTQMTYDECINGPRGQWFYTTCAVWADAKCSAFLAAARLESSDTAFKVGYAVGTLVTGGSIRDTVEAWGDGMCGAYFDYVEEKYNSGCHASARVGCLREAESATVAPQPPSYYCR